MFKSRFSTLLILSVIFTSIFVMSCSKDDDDSSGPSKTPSIVGTWKLTKIHTTIAGQTITMTAEQAQVSMTITFKSDGTYTFSGTSPDGPSNGNGTWSNTSGKFILDGQEVPLTYNSTTMTMTTTMDDGTGNMTTLKMEYTRQ